MAEDQSTHIMLQAVDAVQRATTLDEAVVALVGALQPRLDLWHVSISTLRAEASTVRLLAAWSRAESAFEPGTEVATTITPEIHEILTRVAQGEVVSMVTRDHSDSLVHHLLSEEGIATARVMPVHRDDDGVVLLALGSSGTDSLDVVPQAFYVGLCAGIERKLLQLVGTIAS